MRRHLGPVALFCGLSLMLPACSTSDTTQLKGEIPIGVDIELTGSASAQGAAYRNALNLTVDGINQKGVLGKRIRLVIKDNKSDPATSLRVANGLIDSDRVVALIGGGTSPTTMSIVDTVEKRRVPTVSMGLSDDIISPIDKRQYVFKTPAQTKLIVKTMITAFKLQGIRRVGFLAVESSDGNAGLKTFTEAGRAEGIEVLDTQRFREQDKDLTDQAARLASRKLDAIVVWATPPGSGLAARSIRMAGFKGRVYFDAGAGAELFVKAAANAGENMFMIHPSILAVNQATATTPSVLAQKEFYTEYSQRYGSFSGFASYAADALKLLVAAIQRANTVESKQVRDALETLQFDGLTGSYAFGPGNHGGVSADALSVLTVRNGAWALGQ